VNLEFWQIEFDETLSKDSPLEGRTEENKRSLSERKEEAFTVLSVLPVGRDPGAGDLHVSVEVTRLWYRVSWRFLN